MANVANTSRKDERTGSHSAQEAPVCADYERGVKELNLSEQYGYS